MDVSGFAASGTVVVATSPEVLYDFIADMPSVGKISPQCTGGTWESDRRGVGASFVGTNIAGERSWKARMRVVVADRPREFAWENIGDGDLPAPDEDLPVVRWSYTFTAVDGGTLVAETWRMLNVSPRLAAAGQAVIEALPHRTQGSIEETLRSLKTHFEA